MDILGSQASYLQQRDLSQFLTDSLNPAFNNATDFQDLFFQDAMLSNIDFSVAGSSATAGPCPKSAPLSRPPTAVTVIARLK
jgi:hypothetical protein